MAKGGKKVQAKPKIKHVPYDKELVIFHIDHTELDTLAKGVDLPIYLNLSIFLFSLSGSLIGSMLPTLTADAVCSRWIWTAFYVGAIIFLTGVVLLLIWIVKGKKVRHIVNEIKSRNKKEEGEQLSA
ncbi:MAG TPA: hypothetical protein VNX01_12550 [Bacteroidia bacterium]|jgi:hypothetical protein|nr:hypothetical protein [Bacteroidia bacterium]